MIGRAPTLVLCSRNARPEKGLVRRPHVDQHGCPPREGKTSKLGRIIYIISFDVRSWGLIQATPSWERTSKLGRIIICWTCAVGDQSGHPPGERNARAWKGEGVARCPFCSQSPHDKKDWKDTHVGPVLPERAP